MVAPGRIKLRQPFQQTYGELDGQSVPVYRIFFDIDGRGPYDVMVPRRDFQYQWVIDAVNKLAEQIVMAEDAFK